METWLWFSERDSLAALDLEHSQLSDEFSYEQ